MIGYYYIRIALNEWIEKNLDYSTLLNNFIYLFGYTDLQFRSQHVDSESQIGILEKNLGVKGKKEYQTGIVFELTQNITNSQIIGYCSELEKYNIYLEDIISWFFSNYLQEEFNVNGFHYNASSQTTLYLEKCRNIAVEIDSILKRFNIYCKYGEIDKELLYILTEHTFIKDIPSMMKNKYIYYYGDDFKIISRLLFSSQSIFIYISGTSEHYNSFYDLLE